MTRVLLVDDSMIVRALISATLESVGYVVQTAEDGPGCLAALADFAPDVIVCDLQMPGMSGIEVIRELKVQAPGVPALILTEQSDVGVCVAAMREGATGYVLKGAPQEALIQEIETALEHRQLQVKNRELEDANLTYRKHLESMVDEKTAEILKLQRVQSQAERMSALGTLVAGVAHEVNNPLAVVKSSLSWMNDFSSGLGMLRSLLSTQGMTQKAGAQALDAGDANTLAEDIQTLPEVLSEAGRGVDRILNIVKALKRISKPSGGASVCRVGDGVLDAELQCRALLQSNTEFVRELDASVHEVSLSRDDLSSVLANLLSNAFHALPAVGGKVWLYVRPHGTGGACIEVRDNGSGISPEQLGRVCEPFFTTKDPGKGVGLGLTLAEQVVSAAGGTLTLESELGKGTCARIVLPSVHRMEAPVVAASGRLRI